MIVVGLNHRTAPVELRERVAVPSSRLDKALHVQLVRVLAGAGAPGAAQADSPR